MGELKRACKVIVKVGKTSNIRLRGVKALRAITFNDIERLRNRFGDTKAVIIERILPYEKDLAIEIIERLKADGLFVCLYSIDGLNIQETEIAELTGISVATNLYQLQMIIAKSIAIKVYTTWCREIQESAEDGFVQDSIESESNRNELKEALSSFSNQEKDNDTEYKWVLSKADIEIEQGKLENNVKDKQNTDVASLIALLDEVTKEKQNLVESIDSAQDKIRSLLEIKNSLEKERKEHLDKIQELEDREKRNSEDTTRVELDNTKKEIDALHNTNIELNGKIIAFESDNRVLQEKLDSMTLEIAELRSNIADLNIEIESKNTQIEGLKEDNKSNDSMRLEIMSLKSDKSALESTTKSLSDKISSLTVELSKVSTQSNVESMEKLGELRKEIAVLNEEIMEAKETSNTEIRGRLLLNMMLVEVMKRGEKIEGELEEKNNEILELNTVSKKLRASLSSIEAELQLKTMKYDESVKEIDMMRDKFNTEIDEIRSKSEEDKGRLAVEIESKQSEIRKIRGKVEELEDEIKEKDRFIEEIEESYGNRRDETDILSAKNDELTKKNDELSERNDKLNAKVKSLSKDLSKVEARLSLTEESNSKLESRNKKLRADIEKIESRGSLEKEEIREAGGSLFRLSLGCEYRGKAKIIPVFGTGSIGITTIAMSLAKKINKAKILYMDLDSMSPKANEWFKKMPFLKVSGLDKLKCSSFGLLVEKGSKYMKSHPEFIQNVESNKLGYKLDYFSGSYTRIDPRKLAMIDFSDYITYLGNRYDYIIVDLGKVGASEVGDEIIKMFVDISDKAIFVSLNNMADARIAQMHLTSSNIDVSKLIWVLNLVTSSSVDSGIQKVIKESKCVMIEKDMNIHGEMNLLGSTDRLKGMFNRLVSLVINNEQREVENAER